MRHPLLLALALLVGLAAGAAAEAPTKVAAGYCKVEIGSAQAPAPDHGKPSTSFSTAEILDVTIAVTWKSRGAADDGFEPTLAVRVFTPRGYLYQERQVPFTFPDRPARGRKLAGYPLPVDEQVADAAAPAGADGKSDWRIAVALPVAGTTITRDGLYGDWSVEVGFQDRKGRFTSCVGRQGFSLTP